MNFFETLQQNSTVQGFKVNAVYTNKMNVAMGAQFKSEKTGFTIDLLQIESVPQGFIWVKSPPKWDKGEPHTCEHLLLGKGSVGQHVAALEQMTLGSSTAYTSQIYTCYHFNTTAGVEVFYQTFHAKLNALLHPDFTDEEVRREVCHVGVTEESDGSLWVEEKGTVYTEMVSAFEKPWYYIGDACDKLLYGEGHPLVNNSGGAPWAIRTMTAEDMWDFHGEFHHLHNMGMIASVPTSVDVETYLAEMAETLDAMNDAKPPANLQTGIRAYNLSEPVTAEPVGMIKVLDFPADNADDPGQIRFAYPATLDLGNRDLLLLNQFLSALAGGASSRLYGVLVNSQTRQINPGANWINAHVNDILGNPVSFEMGIDQSFITEEKIKELRILIETELQKIKGFKDGSKELKEFNALVKGHMISQRKRYEQRLNTPPMFGHRRGPAGAWYELMWQLEEERGFRKSLVMSDHFSEIALDLDRDKNIWNAAIDRWHLLDRSAFGVGIKPNPDILKQMETEKTERLQGYVTGFMKKYGTDDEQLALKAYKAEFDAHTAELDALRDAQDLPKFIDNPPLSLDELLDYEVSELSNGVSLVASTFNNMTSATLGLSMSMDVLPKEKLIYIPILPNVMRQIGVVEKGEVVSFDKMETRLREEVLGMNAYFSNGFETGRIELTLRGSGSDQTELMNVIGWMEAVLHSPNLSEDNIPRMIDLIDQSLVGLRNTPKRNEESWVDGPPDSYRFQTSPLYLSANSFMTQAHHLLRLKWRLTKIENGKMEKDINKFLRELAIAGADKPREKLLTVLADPPEMPKHEGAKTVARMVIDDLEKTLPEIPDETVVEDWKTLQNNLRADLMTEPETVLDEIKECLELLAQADNARMFIISSEADRKASMQRIDEFANLLDNESVVVKQYYGDTPLVLERTKPRWKTDTRPTYVGLINENTRNGLIHFGATYTTPYDSSREGILNALSGNLFAGGGSHGLFMKTWGAGLAYSNGIRTRGYSGRVRYYAERCPDMAETMRFVVGVVKDGVDDPQLKEYVIALCFGRSRAADRYESRGEAMAADLADGFSPEVIAAYRRAVLEMRDDSQLWDEVQKRQPEVYGKVFVGFGEPLPEVPNGNFFMIGPETQMISMENYINEVEGDNYILRLYPRDFWVD
ncbi:hypothetical protein ACFLQV_01365 [Calditrichota bacterium]